MYEDEKDRCKNIEDDVLDGELEENDYNDPGSFEHNTQKLSKVLVKAGKDGFQNPEIVMEALGTLIEVASDTIKYVSEQETKQVEIRAHRDIAVAQINATTELIKQYLDKTFDERKDIFNKQFQVVDEALRTGNTEMLSYGLSAINQLAAQNPLKNLADIHQFQQALMDDDYEFDI
ncbi:MAG: hypothetical protein IKY83_08830 [Proteobacteria bacterium]|nr:hypothetical protein [Pseudomonadota bacterium]